MSQPHRFPLMLWFSVLAGLGSVCAIQQGVAQTPPGDLHQYHPVTISIEDIQPLVVLPTTPPQVTYKVVNMGNAAFPNAKVTIAIDGVDQLGSSWSITNLASRTTVVNTVSLGTLPLGMHTMLVSYLQPVDFVVVKGGQLAHQVQWKVQASDTQDFWVLPDDIVKETLSPILRFDEQLAAAQNRSNARGIRPDPTICGPTLCDATQAQYGFLAELQCPGHPKDPKIPYEWYPIVPGTDSHVPTVHTPDFYAAGTIAKWDPGKVDIKFSHPFGWRDLGVDQAVDQSVDVWLDPAYSPLLYPPPSISKLFHIELEAGAWPVKEFGFTPQPGDRMLAIGNWIMDCGHPGTNWSAESHWSSEIHPPMFLALARQYSPAETISHAFANPYRVTQLYTMHAGLGEDWGETFDEPIQSQRYTDRLTLPFPQFFYQRIDDWSDPNNHKPIYVHSIVEPLRFNTVDWYVCAPSKPSDATSLDYTAHFTLRSGVKVVTTKHEESGCIEFQASMDSQYKPMPLQRLDYAWDWADIDCEAAVAAKGPIDVKQLIKDAAGALPWYIKSVEGLTLGGVRWDIEGNLEKKPVIDRFAPLKPIGGPADQQPGLFTSDAQPFPFYGWARVFWNAPIASAIGRVKVNQPQFSVTPDHLDLDNRLRYKTVEVKLVVGISNLTTRAVKIDSATIIGLDAALFRISQDTCSGSVVSLNGVCAVSVMHYQPTHPGLLNATLVISDANKNLVSVPLTAPGKPEATASLTCPPSPQ